MRPICSPRRSRGSSFVEVLVASAMLALLMVGILQMFSLSLLTNQGSASRTELLYKAQQVVENLRLLYFLGPANPAVLTNAGVPSTMAATASPIYLPYYSGDSATSLAWAHWGPAGANIMEEERPPYRLSYTVENYDLNFWLVTVTATPVDNPSFAGPTPGARRYLGAGSKTKIVTYAAQIEK